MAYYLQFDGSNDYATIGIAATSSESWSLEWQLYDIPTGDAFGFARVFGDATPASSNNRISTEIGGGGVSTRFNNVTKAWSGLSFVSTDIFKITYNGSQLELFINGDSKGTIVGTVVTNFQLIGANSNFYTNLALKYAKFINSTTPSKSRDYQPSLSNGTGNVLTDATNGVNGTLVNFTTVDANKWIFYSEGSVYNLSVSDSLPKLQSTASLTFAESYSVSISGDLPKLLSTASLSNTTPEYIMAVSGQLPLSVVSVALSNGIPSYNLGLNAPLPIIGSSVSFTNDLPEYNLNSAGTLPTLQTSVNLINNLGGSLISVNTSLPTIQSSVGITNTTPEYNVNVADTLPLITGQITSTFETNDRVVIVSGNLPKITSSLNITNIVPEFSLGISDPLPIIGGSVSLIDGELIYYASINNVITDKTKSNIQTLKFKSNNVIIKG